MVSGMHLWRTLALCLELTKTSTGGRSPSRRASRSAMSLPDSCPTNTRRCCTLLAGALRCPTVTLTGSLSMLRASSSTFSGSVALNSPTTCTQIAV